jgi:cell division protein FtsN
MLLGVFVGIVIGIGLAAGVAYYLMRNNPALQPSVASRAERDTPKDTKAGTKDAATPEKPRFDFYKILPGNEDAKVQPERKPADKTDRAVAEQARDRGKGVERLDDKPVVASTDKTSSTADAPVKAGDRAWLQAGSFTTAPDAENLRARLALAGLEASVQEGTLADKSTRYRVRLGPYDNADELNRMKAELNKRGFEAAVIRN